MKESLVAKAVRGFFILLPFLIAYLMLGQLVDMLLALTQPGHVPTVRQADVPTADYHVFKEVEAAERFVSDRYDDTADVPVVVKAASRKRNRGPATEATHRLPCVSWKKTGSAKWSNGSMLSVPRSPCR